MDPWSWDEQKLAKNSEVLDLRRIIGNSKVGNVSTPQDINGVDDEGEIGKTGPR